MSRKTAIRLTGDALTAQEVARRVPHIALPKPKPDLYVGEPKKRMTLQGLFDAICETFSEEEAHAVARALNAATTNQATLARAARLFEEALPKFNWGASALDANAIQLLNEVPGEVRAALDANEKLINGLKEGG